MALSDDQRAMLQLLLQRGQSYEDIGGLLGLDVEGVRDRARAALTEIGGADPDSEVGLTDYLLGQADPIGRADAARHLQADGEARELAERLVTQLRVIAPGAELPEIPGDGGRPSKRAEKREKPSSPKPSAGEEAAAASAERSAGGFAATLSHGQRQAIAGLVGGGLIVIVIVLAVAGVFSGGGGGDGSSGSSDGSSSQTSSNASGLTRAVLRPQGGGNAEGVAVFARVRNTPVLQVNVTNLKPTGAGDAYVIWLYGGKSRAFPVVRQPVKANGVLKGVAPIPPQLIQALQQGLFDSIDVSLSTNSQITAALQSAKKGQQLPQYAGTSVARGKITGPGFPAGSSSSSSG
jgi:hypothetical protein